MELPLIVHELRTLNDEYKKRLTDKEPATAVYCNGFISILQKFLEKHNGSYEEYVFSLCIFLCHYAASYGELAVDNTKEKICQQLFRLCIKAVLDVKWKELSEDNTCRQKFCETVDAVHTQLERFDFCQFQLIKTLMDTHWDHPTLSRIMAGADDLEDQEVMEYFAEEDPIVLKVRVEMLLDENCEEFALNLCKWCCLHPALLDNVEIRETQLFMLYRTGNVDKIQEECAKISSEMAVQIIKNLQECEAQQSFCVMIAQTFLVQNWVRGLSADCGTKILLKLWIRLQYLVDGDLDKFSDSIWAIAKLSQHTEQITFLVEALREEAGDTFLQLNTNLCIYAFNLDKGCLEQAVADKDMELILCRNVALSKTSQMIMKLYHDLCPKLAKLSAVTAFSLDPSEENFDIVYTVFHSTNQGSLSSNSITSQHEDNLLDSNSPNKFVNKLTNMLDCLHVSPTKETKRLRPKSKAERNRHSMSHRTVDNVEFCGLSVNPATLYEVERLLNNICPFHLDIDINFTDLRNICMEHLTRHQEMLMVLHEESTDECSEYSNYEDEQADRARISGDFDLAPDSGAIMSLDVDNGTQKIDGCVVAVCEQEVGAAKCTCGPPLDMIGQKSCPSLFEASSNVKYNAAKTACHSNQACPNSVSSRNLFDAFNRDLSSKACTSQQQQQQQQQQQPHHLTVDVNKTTTTTTTTNTIDKEVGYCSNISEKSRFPSCGASPTGNCKCDKSLSVHTCLSFDSQIDFANMMDNAPTPAAPPNLLGTEKSSSGLTSKSHKLKVRDEQHCCCSSSNSTSSLPNTVTDANAVHVPAPPPLKCMCRNKGKSNKKSDKSSLKCDKKLQQQQVTESNNKESQSKSSSSKVPTEDSTTNDKLLEKLKSCISAQTGNDSHIVNEKFTLSKMEKSYIDRYCQFLKSVRQFEMAMLTQKNCKPTTKQKQNYLVVYRCGICCEFFDQVSDLKEHIQSICKAAVMDMKNLTEAASIFSTKDSVLSKIKFFKCLKCLQYTCTRREMDDHLRLCGVPIAKKSSKTADIASPVQKIELHKPSLTTSGNPITPIDSLPTIENNNNNVPHVKIENEPSSEVLSSVTDSSKRLLGDEEGMSAELACKKFDSQSLEMHSQVKCQEENIDKNIKPKSTNEEYFKCQMCGRLLLGPYRHQLHLEACKKRCEWRKDRRLKRMSLAKPSEKARPVMKKETPIASPVAVTVTTTTTTTTTTTMNTATAKEVPMSGESKISISTSRENLSCNSLHSDLDDTKADIKAKLLLPQPEKPKHCPDCERIIKLRKVSQQLGISEKLLIKTEPQEVCEKPATPALPMSSKQHTEIHPVMSESEVDVAAATATAAAVAAAAADLQMETTTPPQEVGGKMNTDECIKRTMLQIKSEMENKQLMEKKAESQIRRISSLLPASSLSADIASKNKLSVYSGCNVSSKISDLAKCKVQSNVEANVRKRSVSSTSPYCRKCDFHFRNRSNFVKHLAITHLQPYTKEEISNPDSNTVVFHCNFCQGAFQVWFKYINHIPNHSALILERLNCKMVEINYSQEDEKSLSSGNDSTNSSDKHAKANNSKTPLKKTCLKLVWPPPEEDVGTFFKRKRRRVTHKTRRPNRHAVAHPNPSLGNLSKITIVNFTQAPSDADDNTKKEILHVMNDLLQKIVGTNEEGHNIMDVGSMPKSVTKKRKPVSLPVQSIPSTCPSSTPISNVTASVAKTFPIPHSQSCTKEVTGNTAKISASPILKETSPIGLEKGFKTQQKGEIPAVASSSFCPLQKIKAVSGGKTSTCVSPHTSKNSGCIQTCLNVPQKNVCSFSKIDASLKQSLPKASFQCCNKNVSIQDKDQDRSSGVHLPSHDKRKHGCSNLKKTCNVKLDNSEDNCKNKAELSLTSHQVDAVKKNEFSETTTKPVQDNLDSTCLHSSLGLPNLCKPTFPHSSCASPSVTPLSSSILPSETSASLQLVSNSTSIPKKPTSSVSLTVPVTTLPALSVSTSESAPTTASKSARFTPSSTALQSTCTHISKQVITTSTGVVSSSMSHPISTPNSSVLIYKSVSSDSSNSTLTKSPAPSITSFLTLQSISQTTTTTTTDISETSVSSSLPPPPPPCPNSFTTTNVLCPLTANSSPPNSICVSTANLTCQPSKSTFTASPVKMHQTLTTSPTPSASVTIMDPLSAIRDPPILTSNANSSSSVVTLSPATTTDNLSTVSVSSVKAPILSTSSSFKSAKTSVASSTSNVTFTNLYSTDNRMEALSSKSVPTEADISLSLKSKTQLSANISKPIESQSNLGFTTITNINTTETVRQAGPAMLRSTTEMCNNIISTTVAKPPSTFNLISKEAVTSQKTTATTTTTTTKPADLNATSKTISTVCPIIQSSAVPNIVSTQPFDITTMTFPPNLSLESTTQSSDVSSTEVPTQPPRISDSDNCTVNLPLPSAAKCNATTAVSTTLSSTNGSFKSTAKVPAANIVSSSSASASTSSNNKSTGSASTTPVTSFQVSTVNTSARTSTPSGSKSSKVSSSLVSPVACKSSVVTVPANASTTTVSKTASSASSSKTCTILEKAAAVTSSITTIAVTSKVTNTSSTSTKAASKSDSSLHKTCIAVSTATSACSTSTISVTSKSTVTVSSSNIFTAASKTSIPVTTSISSIAASKSATKDSTAKTSVSALKVSTVVTPSSTTSTGLKGATTTVLSKPLTGVSTTTVPKITSATSSANTTTLETLKPSSKISKSTVSNIVSKTTSTVLPINISTTALTSSSTSSSVSTNLTSVSKSPTMNISETSRCLDAPVNCSKVTDASSSIKSLVHCTEKSSAEKSTVSSCTTTMAKKDSTESIVTSCSTVSVSGTTPTLSTAALNSSSSSSFSPSTFTTASSLSTSSTNVTFVTTSVTASTSAIKQGTNKSDNDQILAPVAEMPKLAAINISSSSSSSSSSSRIENPAQPLTEKKSATKTESVGCSSEDSISELKADCTNVAALCKSEKVEKSKTERLKEDSNVPITSPKDCEMSDNEEKALEANIFCQSPTSLHCSQTSMQLIINEEGEAVVTTTKCEIDSNDIDSSQFCVKKSSKRVNCTTDSACESSSCNSRLEMDSCDVKLSTACENISRNRTCREDKPVSSNENCKLGCNQETTENCDKNLCLNDLKVKCKEIVENESAGCSSSMDGDPQNPNGNEDVVECSRESMNENAIYDKHSSIDKKTAEFEEVTMLKSQISEKDSDEQCKKKCPANKVAPEELSEELSEVDDSRENAEADCQDKEKIHTTHTKQLRRPRGRPRKTNTELLLASVASRQKLLNPGNIINFRLRKDRPTLKAVKCGYCCCKKRCQTSCVQNTCKSCIVEGTSVCRCNLNESQLNRMQKVALSNSTMCLSCHSNNKRASRGTKRKRSPSPKPIRRRSSLHSPLRSSSVSNQKTSGNTRLQKISNVPFKKKLANSPRKNLVSSPHKKSLASSSHKKMTGVNLKKLSSEYHKPKQFTLFSDKNITEEFSKESSVTSLKSESSSDELQDTKNAGNVATRRTLRSRKSLDETTPVIRQLRRSKSEQKLDSCTGDISKKQTDLLTIDNSNGTLLNSKLSQNLENKINAPLPCCDTEEECYNACTENHDKKFVGNRALKELRQRVKLGPFKWDLEESETGGRAHSMAEGGDSKTDMTTTKKTTSATNAPLEDNKLATTQASLTMFHSSMPPSPSASSPSFSSPSPSATADDELLGTGVTPPIRTYSRTQSPPSRIRVGRTYSKASDYQALPPGVMPVMPIIDCLRPTSHSSASHLCDMPRVHVVRVDKKGNMFETREPYPLPRNPLDLDMSRTVVDDEKGGGHRWKLQRTKMKTDGYPFSFKKTRIQ